MAGKGLVHVYTGCGKGKTSASLGIALRAIGWGCRVCVVQFIKGYSEIGERFFSDKNENMTFIQTETTDRLCISQQCVLDRKNSSCEALKIAQNVITSGEYDIVILDEINGAVKYNLIDLSDLVDLIKNKPSELELILTGRDAHEDIIALADYVTEMRMIKHPYEKGIVARKTIDY